MNVIRPGSLFFVSDDFRTQYLEQRSLYTILDRFVTQPQIRAKLLNYVQQAVDTNVLSNEEKFVFTLVEIEKGRMRLEIHLARRVDSTPMANPIKNWHYTGVGYIELSNDASGIITSVTNSAKW